jgi:hypothetical protein
MKKLDMPDKITQLETWAKDHGIDNKEIARVFEMLCLGRRESRAMDDPIQFPACYIIDEQAMAWHNPQDYPWVSLLEEYYEEIKKEALNAFNENLMDVHPENEDLAEYGAWNTFFLYKNGKKYFENHNK